MIPSATTSAVAPKPVAPGIQQAAQKTPQSHAPEAARSSAGETAAGSLRAETARAVDASKQAVVAPRLRDQDTAERTERALTDRDAPTGPPPAFEESPLERQARVALEPPEILPETEHREAPEADAVHFSQDETEVQKKDVEPPPTPREKAEVSFAETRSIAAPRSSGSIDISA